MMATKELGSSINDVKDLGGFRDVSTKAFVPKSVTMGGGPEGCQKLSKIARRHLWKTKKIKS